MIMHVLKENMQLIDDENLQDQGDAYAWPAWRGRKNKTREEMEKVGIGEKQSLTGNNFVNFVEPAKEGRKERIELLSPNWKRAAHDVRLKLRVTLASCSFCYTL